MSTSKSNKHKKTIGNTAAETTTAFSPIVGVHKNELIRSLGSLIKQASLNPATFGKHFFNYSKDILDIVKGDSEYEANPKDRRFKDSAWTKNPLYRRGMQTWMAFGKNLNNWVNDADIEEIDRARATFILNVITDSFVPTNTLVGNPTAMKKMYETGGQSIIDGLKNAYHDMVNGNGMPSQVDSRPFKVGENLAVTDGKVVFQNDVLELIQYKPQSDKVLEIPTLVIPPQINKFYIFDLDQNKSLFDFLSKQGNQTFAISWRNPGPEQADWGLNTYVYAIIEAMDAIKDITGQKKVNVAGACSGGITSATLISYLSSTKAKRINSSSFFVCVLNPQQTDNDLGILMSNDTLEMARKKSQKNGILAGEELSRTFAWMRPNDLIWNYVVNNYLLGEAPPAFDVLYWNNDTTNLPATLHSNYLNFYIQDPFGSEGDDLVHYMDHDITMRNVQHDSFFAAGTTDHITPWRACFRTAHLVGGQNTFVLSNSGHVQSLINPPTNPKANYFVNDDFCDDPDEWLKGAKQEQGSWWTVWNEWLSTRSGKTKPAPKKLGSKKYPPLGDAPGEYIYG